MATPGQFALTKLSHATKLLTQVRDAPSAKQLMDLASSAKHYATKAKLGWEAINLAHSVSFQAETLLGGYLLVLPKQAGSRGVGKSGLPKGKSTSPTMADLGLTHKQTAEAQFLARLAKTHPKEHQAIVRNEKTITQVKRQLRREVGGTAVLPAGKYRVFYADPPWDYGDKRERHEQAPGASAHYPSMSLQALCDLPIAEMSSKSSVLFLWVTSPMLEVSFTVIRAWGFQYKTSFVWDKVKHNMGHYNSVRHEFLLLATKGSCLPDTPELIDSVVSIARSEKHSQKPEEFRTLIDKLYPRGPRIELFARERAQGWEAYGNQI